MFNVYLDCRDFGNIIVEFMEFFEIVFFIYSSVIFFELVNMLN